ncbi:MerR family transcriptional regulator [Fructilactobacillus sp. Tb1]|uniref:MerR family transcriptional regulator n=1 Tax=Fructilactobacillus sp. Tb1 TaxID=3422304 RepID=UPI003D26E138
MKKYTVAQLAKISGVSPRTIRYYDKVNLLKPSEIEENGYRKYDKAQLDKLQQILYFKNFGFKLEKIKAIINSSDYDVVNSLKIQQQMVEREIIEQQKLLKNLKKAVKYYKGEINMTDDEKFTVLKNNKIKENEINYGEELRKNYRETEIQGSINTFNNLTKEQYEGVNKMEKEMITNLDEINESNLSLDSNLAKRVFKQHQKWLMTFNQNYNSQYHLAMAELYSNDNRFKEHYNEQAKTNVADTLIKIINKYAK